MRQTEAPRSSVKDLKPHSPSFLDNVIPTSLPPAATTGVTFINDRLALKEAFCCDNQLSVALTDLVRDDSIFGIFLLAQAVTFKAIAAASFSTGTSDIKIRVVRNPFNTCPVLITVDELKVIC